MRLHPRGEETIDGESELTLQPDTDLSESLCERTTAI